MLVGGKRKVVRLCFGLLCPDLAGFGSAAGDRVASGDSQPGEGLGAPAVAGGLHADPNLQESCVSTWTGIYLRIPFQSS